MPPHTQNNYSLLSKPTKVTEHDWPNDIAPLVTIACKTYMHAPFIRDAIEGFLMQETTFPVEILIHDDASHDATADVIREYEKKYPQLIKATYQIENQRKKKPKTPKYVKPYPQRGKYIAKCEGDDFWTDPLKLQMQVCFLESNPDYSITCGGFLSIDASTGSKEEVVKFKPKAGISGYTFSHEDMLDGWITKTLTTVYRKDALVIEETKKYRHRRDVHLFYHLIKNGKGFYFTRVLGVYRIHPGGVFSSKSYKEQLLHHSFLYKELYCLNRDEFTRRMYLKTTLLIIHLKFKEGLKTDKKISLLNAVLTSLKLIRLPRDICFLLRGAKKKI